MHDLEACHVSSGSSKRGQAVPDWEFGHVSPKLGSGTKCFSSATEVLACSLSPGFVRHRNNFCNDEALQSLPLQQLAFSLKPQRGRRRNSYSDANLLSKTWVPGPSCGSPLNYAREKTKCMSKAASAGELRRPPTSGSEGKISFLQFEADSRPGSRSTKDEHRQPEETMPSPRMSSKDTEVGSDCDDLRLSTKSAAFTATDCQDGQETISEESTRESTPRQLAAVQGCPGFADALLRLRSGGFSPCEFVRVRQAYYRFAGDDDLDKECLKQVLAHLGYIFSEELVETEADRITNMSTFDMDELDTFLQEYASHELDLVKIAFEKQAGGKKTILVEQLLAVLRDLEIMTLRSDLDDLQVRANLVATDFFDFNGLLRIIAAYRSCEGFTAEELEKAKKSFDAAVDCVDVKVEDMPNALIPVFSVHCIKDLRNMLETAGEALKGKAYATHGVTYPEFLTWARCLQNADRMQLWNAFKNVDKDEDDAITSEELMLLMKDQGFTLSNLEADECFEAAGLQCKRYDLLSFDDAAAYLKACRQTEGFTILEREELMGVFKKFDTDGQGSITTGQVLDLLRHLGYAVTVDEVDRYAKQVDFNCNGTMEIAEWLHLMRLHAEDDLDQVNAVFRKLIAGQNQNASSTFVHDALQELSCCPAECSEFDMRCQEAIASCTMRGVVDMPFDTFKSLADQGRKAVRLERRQRANFPEAEFALLQNAWAEFDIQGKGCLDKKQVVLLMRRSGLVVHTEAGRRYVSELLDKARAVANEEELSEEEIGEEGSGMITFCVMVHAWRLVARENEGKRLAEMDEAKNKSRFSKAEVDEFRQIFTTYVKKSVEPMEVETLAVATVEARRRSVPELSSVHIRGESSEPNSLTLESVLGIDNNRDMLTLEALKPLLSHLKLRLSPKLQWTLEAKVEEISNDEQCKLSFPDFLYLMRWMLDTDFAGLNEITAAVVKDSHSSSHAPPSSSPAHFSSALAWPSQSQAGARRGSI